MSNIILHILKNVPCVSYLVYDDNKLFCITPAYKDELAPIDPRIINKWLDYLCTKQHQKISYGTPCAIFRSILPNGLPIEIHATGSMLTPINMGATFDIKPMRMPNVAFD